MSYIRRYIGFARCATTRRISYRGALFVSFFSNGIGAAVKLMLWFFLFTQQTIINGYTWPEMAAYLLIVLLSDAMLSYSTERTMSERVLDGSIATDLIKPMNIQDMCLFEALGASLIETLLALPIIIALAAILGCFSVIGGWVQVALFVLSLPLAFMVKFALAYIAGLMCFYTSNGYGVIYLRQVITDIFSGALIPLSFYPAWFQTLSSFLPFQAAVYLPAQIFLGRISGMEVARAFGIQLFWAVALWILGKLLFRFAMRKITIHGG